MPITALPLPPSRSDAPATFVTKADAFVAALPVFQAEASALQTDVNAKSAAAVAAEALATPAAAVAVSASLAASNAANTQGTSTTSIAIPTALPIAGFQLTTQTAKNFIVGMTIKAAPTGSVGSYVIGEVTSYNSGTGVLVMTVTHSRGVGTFASWNVFLNPSVQTTVNNAVVPKSATFNVSRQDIGTHFEAIGTFTITHDLAAALGNGLYYYVENVSTGAITIDPNGSELVNGAATYIVQPKATVLILCDGTKLKATQVGGPLPTFKASDQKASGTSGGTSANGDNTQTRTLNTVDINTLVGASLSANAITLPAGTYDVFVRTASVSAGPAKAYLYNTSDAVYTLIGDSGNSDASGWSSSVIGQFTITASKNFVVRQYTQSGVATYGLGNPVSSGQVEVYTEAIFKKVA